MFVFFEVKPVALFMVLACGILCWTDHETVSARQPSYFDSFQRFSLENGLTVLIKPMPGKRVATLQYWILVGSADETESERGISHLIEHMAFKGTRNRGVGETAKEVEALGGEIDANVNRDRTVFSVTVPSEAAIEGLEILSDAVLNPVTDPRELEKEKEVVIEEIRQMRDRTSRRSSGLLFETAFTRSRYRYPVAGSEETVKGFTPEDIGTFRKKWYVAKNIFLLIVGDVEPVAMRVHIETLAGELPPGSFARPPRPSEPTLGGPRSALVRDSAIGEARMHLAFHIPPMKHSDIPALDVAAAILGESSSSRLVDRLREMEASVNAISVESITLRERGLFVISARLDAGNLVRATRSVAEELRRLGDETPPEDELERAKISVETGHAYAKETVDGLADRLGACEVRLGKAENEAQYLNEIAKTTPGDISQAVRRYFHVSNAILAVMVPEDELPELGMQQLVDVVRSLLPSGDPRGSDGSLPNVVAKTLPNGIRVVLQSDESNTLASFRIGCLGGKRFETHETNGIMNLLSRVLTKGTKELDAQAIDREIARNGGTLRGFSGYESFGISSTFLGRYVNEGLQLLVDIYQNASIPSDRLETERRRVLSEIKTASNRPFSHGRTILNETLFSGHPSGYTRLGTVRTVSALTRNDLIRELKRLMVPQNTVIVGVGDFDAKKTMNRISKLFGNIPASSWDMPLVPPQKPITRLKKRTVKVAKKNAYLMIGFRGTTYRHEDRYPLEVLTRIFSLQGGRLFSELRDRQPLAYSMSCLFRPGLEPGPFFFYVSCSPGKIDRATKVLFREIDRVRTTLPSEAEILRAKTNLIGTHFISLQSCWSRAEAMVLNELYGLRYDYEPQWAKKISEVTPAQVFEAARKYLDPERCAVVRLIPDHKFAHAGQNSWQLL